MARGRIPPRWLHCPRKSSTMVANRFLVIKTPLDKGYDEQIPIENRFHPQMIFSVMASYKVKIGLWIDLTATSRFYSEQDIQSQNCHYVKIRCRGHEETPSREQVTLFVQLCKKFTEKNICDAIVVHCTHGFNRSGFMICSYLIEEDNWSPEAALQDFSKSRPPGIYKKEYIDELFRRYGDVEDAPNAPILPNWCFDSETGVDEDGHSVETSAQSAKTGTFMEGISGVEPVRCSEIVSRVHSTIRNMTGFRDSGFTGAQPVSMDCDNINLLSEKSYQVSWKADGTRYMMLVLGSNEIYLIDRDNCVYRVSNLTFRHRKDPTHHITNSLLDGEMVIDEDSGQHCPRYLIYDIITFENNNVGDMPFSTRHKCIENEFIAPRVKYLKSGLIERHKEPFGIRKKNFWDISQTDKLLGPKFTKKNLGHEPDGLVFQPSGPEDAYKCGRDDFILKWKPHTHNSIDFKLVIEKEVRVGLLDTHVGKLYVGGCSSPFAEIKVNKQLRQYDKKIIECNFAQGEWKFMRERTDKSFPNAYSTAKAVMQSIRRPVTEETLLRFIDQLGSESHSHKRLKI